MSVKRQVGQVGSVTDGFWVYFSYRERLLGNLSR